MRSARGILVACLLLVVPACMSKNKGKILGKWESTSAPPGVSMTLEFMADGRFSMGLVGPMVAKTITGKYSLGFGDAVTLSNLSEPISGSTTHRETITIVGSQLTMKDSDGQSMTFKKM